MSGVPVGQRAVGLSWICPSVDALIGLASDPPEGSALAADPAAIAHILRFARPSPTYDSSLLSEAVLAQPSLCINASVFLESSQFSFNPEPPEAVLRPVERVISVAGAVADRLARQFGGVSPDVAVCLTRLAALGWWAIAAVEPAAVDELLQNGRSTPAQQRQRLGLDVAAIGRRLCLHWRLPSWICATQASLPLTVSDAVRLGAPNQLFRIVQAAISAAELRYGSLGWTGERRPLDLLGQTATRLVAQFPDECNSHSDLRGSRELFARLLRSTGKSRQASAAVWLADAEERADRLFDALQELQSDFRERLRDAKLASMAEFAAGASHEINNPLTVISGHAQLLLASETDLDRRKQLETIVSQTKRIHELLRGAMQFARPVRPREERVLVAGLINLVIDGLSREAQSKNVELRVNPAASMSLECQGDRSQLRQALTHLVRNAIDAVSSGGWVRLSIQPREQAIAICVDDNGPGPDPLDTESLFDPFFSGRSAGRGRGLGLSIAWRLARINGAVVRYRADAGPVTRFELVLRMAVESIRSVPFPERRTA